MINLKQTVLIASLATALTGCYVVPVQYPAPNGQNAPYATVPAGVPVQLSVLTARLYPVNETAAAIGRLSGTISRPEKGHGIFSLMAGSETYSGEATRAPGSSKGTANASGNQGGYIKCDYTMTNAVLGSGVCIFSNGARFDMHISG